MSSTRRLGSVRLDPIPVGASHEAQELLVITKRADGGIESRRVLPVRFVPLVPGN